METVQNEEKTVTRSQSNNISVSIVEEKYDQYIDDLCKALSSPIRRNMLRQLHERPMTIMELARHNGISNSTAIFHLNILRNADVIKIKYLPSQKGIAQVNFLAFNNIYLTREGGKTSNDVKIDVQSLGVGCYSNADMETSHFGLATKDDFIHTGTSSFDPRRFQATMIWTFGGRVDYAFPNSIFRHKKVQKLQFSLEICSETTCFRNDWKSDIFFAVNGMEAAHYLSPGDFGGTRARFTPEWWPQNMTQYGILVTIDVTDEGTFVNQVKSSDVTLSDLALHGDNKIMFSVYNKKDSTYYGGFNLFGKNAGNYDQDIVLATYYQD